MDGQQDGTWHEAQIHLLSISTLVHRLENQLCQLLHIWYPIQFESLLESRGKPLVSEVVKRNHLLFEISEERRCLTLSLTLRSEGI